MGRKSSKAKEKKQKRLEERAAMDAVCAKVEAANRLGDPLEAFPVFKKYDRNGTQMKKVMLTVFKHNRGAYQFFREALQFEIDDSSPSMSGCCGEDCSYEILSRRTKFGDSQHSHVGGHCGGCCH
ncbi:N-alpha-acetyltransferase 40, NatD catalytic subunit [Phyllostomus discolor]|uniref:N-alpha-acetyltransferase 40, NatD catalytic subunit n=1 Tax=Phyllostomus discolor TaxID=89673 RepID=A0A833ZXU7_9CHIR|nr:N-alpha-acetyltransferase 40, NatD catalytic subunit [Phyllostomus discolor]